MTQFTPFNPFAQLKQTWRTLPHWDQPNATYFLTFRLADSIPAGVQARFAEWRELSGSRAFAEADRRLDAGKGRCFFSNPRNSAIMAATLRNFDGSRYLLGAFVVMPNHAHVLVQPSKHESVSRLLHSWKSYSAHQLRKSEGASGDIWQDERFDRIVRNQRELQAFHDYILANPAAARLPKGSYVVGQGQARWFA